MVRVYVPGVFDVFHVGHLNYLRRASELGDNLIVGVQDDRSVQKQKKIKPIVPLADRMAIIGALAFVDEEISYVSTFQGPLLQALRIDVFAVGEEYGQDARCADQQRTLQFCREQGIRVEGIPRTPHVSSTKVREQLKDFWSSCAAQAAQQPVGVTCLGSFSGDQQQADVQTRREVEMILREVPHPEQKTLLDLGCGDGRLLVPLAEHFGQVIGVDYVPEMVLVARRRLGALESRATLVVGDISEFQPPQPCDVILLSGVVPYLDDAMARQLVERVASWATPDALLVVRNSVGLSQRVDVVQQYSEELGTRYTAFYRTGEQIVELLQAGGWSRGHAEQLFQHRPDTAMWWFTLRRSASAMPATMGAAPPADTVLFPQQQVLPAVDGSGRQANLAEGVAGDPQAPKRDVKQAA